MKKGVYYTLLTLVLSGIPISIFGIINIMASLKYETELQSDCVSLVTGQDLCFKINIFKGLAIACSVIVYTLLILRNRILK